MHSIKSASCAVVPGVISFSSLVNPLSSYLSYSWMHFPARLDGERMSLVAIEYLTGM